jgi:hypothetical protein
MASNLGWQELLFLAVIFGFACGGVASRKGRSPRRWSILGFVFGPFALVAVCALRPSTP